MTSTLSGNAESTIEQRGLPPSMVERMTLILDLFDRPHRHLMLDDVVQRTQLPRSTAHRILEQLARMRWLDHSTAGYRLGARSLGLGGREVGRSALRVAAAPVLHELAMRTELVVHLGVLDGTTVYYLDKVGGQAAVEVPSRVGGRAPAHCTALGKAMLASLAPEQVDVAYERGLPRRTPRTIVDLGLLHQELSRVRSRHGLAFEHAECFPGITCVGVALRSPDGQIGAISLVGDTATALDWLAPTLLTAARAIGQEMREPGHFQPRSAHDGATFTSQEWSGESMTHFLAARQRDVWL